MDFELSIGTKMCLIFLALKRHPQFKLIVAANRDEFYNRKTAAAGFWPDAPILGGRDLEAGGTWLGMNKNGKIGMVTNYRDPANINPNAPSRGQLVTDYLNSLTGPEKYLEHLAGGAAAFNGFNLLIGEPDAFWYFSNYRKGITELKEGIFGLSNHLLESPWPKIQKGKEKLTRVLEGDQVTLATLFQLLYDDHVAPDELLPNTGVGLLRERALSSMFIKSPGYGTRCSTVILVDYEDNVTFAERVYNLETFEFITNTFEFQIDKTLAV
jgi:uncharacterized protein with NRDE domain